jgi:hypothetical protein
MIECVYASAFPYLPFLVRRFCILDFRVVFFLWSDEISRSRAEKSFRKLSSVAEPGWFSRADIILGRR